MYVPKPFVEDRPEELHAMMRACSLPILVSPVRAVAAAEIGGGDAEAVGGGDAGRGASASETTGTGAGLRLMATHLPLLLDGDRLIGHLARANPQWRRLDPSGESLAIFSGVDGYVSPSLYATKALTGRVVPTWNYEAVHAYGRLEVIEDAARILEVVTSLTHRHEQDRPAPWQVTDAPADYVAAQLRQIVAVVLHVTRTIGVRKLSQNKTPADRDGVIEGQRRENPGLAERMSAARPR